MHGARHVGVVLAVMAINRFDDLQWLLAGIGVIEIHQRFAVHRASKQPKISAYALHIEVESRLAWLGIHGWSTQGRCASSASEKCSRRVSFGNDANTARQNAVVRNARASACGKPRERK